MTVFIGGLHRQQAPRDWISGFHHIVSRISGAPTVWQDPSAILVQHLVATTAEARLESLPLPLAGGNGVLALDGRLDNRADLIAALNLGTDSHRQPDGSLLALAWERWGAETPARLLGDFALAVWDGRTRRLTLACDQTTGGRPLFWYAASDHILFANDLAALLAVPWVPRTLDPEAVSQLLHQIWPRHGRTPFRHIRQIPPGGRLIWSDGTIIEDRYWRPDWTRQLRLRRAGDYVDAGRELLDRAVAAHCRVDGPLVCQLSGGLDSTAVTATAARLFPSRQIDALTMVPDPAATFPAYTSINSFSDEAGRAKSVADLYPNIRHHVIPAQPMDPDDLYLTSQFAATAMPVRSVIDATWYAPVHQRPSALGANVVLVGFTGNLTLSHDASRHLADLLRQGQIRALLQQAAALNRWKGGETGLWPLIRAEAVKPLLPPSVIEGMGIIRNKRPPKPLRFARIPMVEDRSWTEEPHGGPQSSRLRHWMQYYHGTFEGRRIVNTQRRRLFQIETRDPLGYLPLFEFCLAVPPEQYLYDGVPRSLARRVLADRLPELVANEKGKGRQCPEYLSRAAPLAGRFRQELEALSQSNLAAEFLDLSVLRSVIIPWSDAPDADIPEMTLRPALASLHIGQYLHWVEKGCPGLPAWPKTAD